MAPSEDQNSKPAVRFSSANEEIEPERSLSTVESVIASKPGQRDDLTEEAQQELKNLSMTLQNSQLQHRRMSNFAFEPVSLPASRAQSPSRSGTQTPQGAWKGSYSGTASPRPSPPVSSHHMSPPLTPAATQSKEGKAIPEGDSGKVRHDPAMMTPQVSPPHESVAPTTSVENAYDPRKSSTGSASSCLPMSTSSVSGRPRSVAEVGSVDPTHPKPRPSSVAGPIGGSLPVSREGSPPGTPGTRTPGGSTLYSRPWTPSRDPNDIYARNKRPPPSRNVDSIEARFKFGGRDAKKGHTHSTSTSAAATPRTSTSTTDSKSNRHGLFGGKHDERHSKHEDGDKHQHSSMAELKRFFKIGGHKKDKRSSSPAGSIKHKNSGTRTPPSYANSVSMPFGDDHGLQTKYGKFGKVLGSGAGGSVRLMKRSSDGVTFAVKQFRSRHAYETEREYNKKVTAEFCVGSTMHHGNIIETMDLVHEKGNWYVVMEYAPYDLFAIVMTGKMSREEVGCCTLQILAGVTYLHSLGLAHRDLKLDNVVVNEHGIMKIIDFGSAAVFRYPFENDIVLASGIVGSDPYLAPEVYDMAKYDPQPADIWSLAIIFCCMTLRRFPWKAPRVSDNSYKLFVSPPNDGPGSSSHHSHHSKSSVNLAGQVHEARQTGGPYSEPASRQPSANEKRNGSTSDPSTNENNRPSTSSSSHAPIPATKQQEVIKGPWRLLRLLPRESRHIIGRMLEVDPNRRATLEEILEDPWVANSPVCSQEINGQVIKAGTHAHTLEPGASGGTQVQSQGSKKK